MERPRDSAEISARKEEGTKKPEASSDYQKYAPGMFTREEWAENSILEQRDGIRTVSDVIDYAKSKLQYTMSKIEELENYLNGTGTHSDPNMTEDLAKTYGSVLLIIGRSFRLFGPFFLPGAECI